MRINRLEDVECLDNVNDTESFAMDDLGNRDGSQTLRGGTISYTVNDDTNRYTVINGNNVSYDKY